MTWPPIDSSESRERRAELEAEEHELEEQRRALADEAARRQHDHDRYCVKGWLQRPDDPDSEDHPTPCIRCRPTLGRVACYGCGEHPARCASGIEQGRGSCCQACQHTRGATR